MPSQALADAVVVVHFAFVVFVALGGLLALRWPKLLWAHVPSVAWGAVLVGLGLSCPLTGIERNLRERGGTGLDDGGFIARYLEGVIYPDGFTPHLRVFAGLAIAATWTALVLRREPRRQRSSWAGSARRAGSSAAARAAHTD